MQPTTSQDDAAYDATSEVELFHENLYDDWAAEVYGDTYTPSTERES
ncbi:hypothetical protein [Streptomyces melanogenes]|nr:hypothetical protein [Streptomyces melanogenes]GGP82277.1 hypothetical protein GCM10010278_71110 [Streptomyces melanogenes]